MAKSDKELAIELAGRYLQGYYSNCKTPLTPEGLEVLLKGFYEAVQKLPNPAEASEISE